MKNITTISSLTELLTIYNNTSIKPKAIIFDCFNTILKINNPQNPYKYLFNHCLSNSNYGLNKEFNNITVSNEGFDRYHNDNLPTSINKQDLWKHFKYFILTQEKAPIYFFEKYHLTYNETAYQKFKELLWLELDSINFFNQAEQALIQLSKQYPIIICSNLAFPYVSIVEKLLKQYNLSISCVFSCQAHLAKPEQAIYAHCHSILSKDFIGLENSKLSYKETVFVGDSLKNDYQVPKQIGMKSLLLKS